MTDKQGCPPEHNHHGTAEAKAQAVFGGADGLTTAIGLVVSLGLHHPHVVFIAAVGAALAGFSGMAGGAWLSGSSKMAALMNGFATILGGIVPALPWVFLHGLPAIISSVVLTITIGSVITWLRPERGWRAVAQTFGVLVIACVLCYFAILIGA